MNYMGGRLHKTQLMLITQTAKDQNRLYHSHSNETTRLFSKQQSLNYCANPLDTIHTLSMGISCRHDDDYSIVIIKLACAHTATFTSATDLCQVHVALYLLHMTAFDLPGQPHPSPCVQLGV